MFIYLFIYLFCCSIPIIICTTIVLFVTGWVSVVINCCLYLTRIYFTKFLFTEFRVFLDITGFIRERLRHGWLEIWQGSRLYARHAVEPETDFAASARSKVWSEQHHQTRTGESHRSFAGVKVKRTNDADSRTGRVQHRALHVSHFAHDSAVFHRVSIHMNNSY